jgi:hypothetical protein
MADETGLGEDVFRGRGRVFAMGWVRARCMAAISSLMKRKASTGTPSHTTRRGGCSHGPERRAADGEHWH